MIRFAATTPSPSEARRAQEPEARDGYPIVVIAHHGIGKMVTTRSAKKAPRPPTEELPPTKRKSRAKRAASTKAEAAEKLVVSNEQDTAVERKLYSSPARPTSTATSTGSAKKQTKAKSKGEVKKGASAAKRLKEEEFEYEFGGPIGALATTILLPIVTLLLTACASAGRVEPFFSSFALGGSANADEPFLSRLLSNPVLFPGCQKDGFKTLLQCMACIVGWFLFQVVLERLLPCEIVEGAPLKGSKSGERLKYRINGHLAFWVTILVVFVGWPSWVEITMPGGSTARTIQFGRAPLGLLYDYHAELALSTILLCIVLSTYLYLRSCNPNLLRADGGNSGSTVYDFFMGRELNPRWGSFDWKEFCELRPGLIGWALLNMAMVVKQQEKLGYVTGSMMLINAFQGLYVWDALYQERAILTTMDITTDGFGFMLVFGDLAWVPFTYSLQARYLVDHDPHLGPWHLVAVLATNALGYCIFRGANGQKDAFRRNPDAPEVKHLKYLQTKRGTRLLTSGWWGAARKINYTGDWIMGLSWCMLCGFDSIVPYYYAIYFAILLVHRSIRDDGMCKAKYGEDWDEYKRLVPYRFVPGLF